MTNATSPPATITIRLLGTPLTLRSDGDPARVERLAAELDARLSRVAAEANLSGQPTRAVILAALGLLEEHDALRARLAALERLVETRTASMLGRIEATLALEEAPA